MRYISCKDIYIACPFIVKDYNYRLVANNHRVAIMFYIIGYPHVIQQFNQIIFSKKQEYDTYDSGSKIKILSKDCYDSYTYKDEKTGINSVLYVYNNKRSIDYNNEINFYMYYNRQMPESELHLLLSKNINKYTDLPILEQWSDYLWTSMQNNMRSIDSMQDLTVYNGNARQIALQLPLVKRIVIRKNALISLISNGLKNNVISISGFNTNTNKIDSVTGLDSYLNAYSNILANKIQNAYRPQFVPGEDTYNKRLQNFDDSCYFNNMNLFYAQKCTIQATANALRNKKATFIIGEQGSGKTVMSLGACYSYKNKDGFNAIIMCPSHLVNKWQREIQSYVPNGKSYIIKNINDIIKLNSIIRNKKKVDNIFLIMSKETAKLDNEYRPNVYYSISKRHYVCPHCGKPIKSVTDKWHSYLYDTDFRKQLVSNSTCYECGTNLWVPVSDNNDHWIKLGNNGWVNSLRIENIYNNLINKESRNKQESDFLRAIEVYRNDNTAFTQPNYTRYPLAKYIHNKYKGYIDFLIGDELHLYNGDSAQGEAFGHLASVANKVIGLTGTLLNGYADSIFYMLFRTMPDVMLNEGFDNNDIAQFNQEFGVIKNTRTLAPGIGGKVTSYTKKLPGVSPLVFTKFLLENAVFVNLSDMLDGLPNYSEYPIGITMSDTLTESYTELETKIAEELRKNKKIISSATKVLSAYPDYPYELEPIVNPENNTIVAIPKNMDISDTILPKEQRLLDIVEEKHNNNEKVLVYYTWTNMIDLDNRLKQVLENRGYRVGILKASVSAQNREQWIKDHIDNIDVLLCNPSLVETGLDLLDFTAIVFYEIGYNLFTMRQSSRRSWRLGQTRPISVYYLYYQNTIQEQALSLMATKLQASMAIEGKFSEEGLQALSDNEDILTQIANNIVDGIKSTVNENCFKTIVTEQYHNNDIENTNDYEFNFDIDSIDNNVDIENNTTDIDDSAIVQNIISEPTKIFRRTKYEIEGKKYNMYYWNNENQNISMNNNIMQILNNNQNIEEICDCTY